MTSPARIDTSRTESNRPPVDDLLSLPIFALLHLGTRGIFKLRPTARLAGAWLLPDGPDVATEDAAGDTASLATSR